MLGTIRYKCRLGATLPYSVWLERLALQHASWVNSVVSSLCQLSVSSICARLHDLQETDGHVTPDYLNRVVLPIYERFRWVSSIYGAAGQCPNPPAASGSYTPSIPSCAGLGISDRASKGDGVLGAALESISTHLSLLSLCRLYGGL